MGLFAEVSGLKSLDDRLYEFSVPGDWLQGRTAFGGLVVGAALRAMLCEVPQERQPRSLLTQFVGPVTEGSAQVRVEILRSGRALTQVEARVLQGEQTCAVVLGSFGEAHEVFLDVERPAAPIVLPPEELNPMPFLEGMTPNFTQHVDIRWTTDSFPYSGSAAAHCQGWMRLKETTPTDWPTFVALIDAWPPPIFSKASGFVVGSSVTWQVNFFADLPDPKEDPHPWWLFDGVCTAAHVGYADTDATLFNKKGELVARSRQLAVEFSK